MQHLTGIGVSPGLALGQAVVSIQRTQVIRFPIAAARVPRELAALEAARERSRRQLLDIRERIARSPGAELAALFDAHLLILDDPMLTGRAAELVREDHVNAEWAVQRVLEELGDVFESIEDPYLRDRKGDLADVAGRLRMNLRHAQGDLFRDLEGPYVLIADELTPSVVAQMDWSHVRGFATDAGSRTYHTAILARSLRVPAVVGLHDVSRRVVPGAQVIIDGESGEVIIDATPEQVAETAGRSTRVSVTVAVAPGGPARTADGVAITLEANIELSGDLSTAMACGADGIGLYRSEFLLAGAPADAASEDEQYDVYRHMVERMAPAPVTIRTFDIDERQLAAGPHGTRGFGDREHDRRAHRAGLRGIRVGLAYPELLRTQLRAILRAAVHGPVRVLLPFVSTVEEVRAARLELDRVHAELAEAGLEVPPVPLGAMIEVPSAACTADLVADEADFFTIGTNDLIQYTLAVDRTDERVSDRYEPLQPAVLRLIRRIAGAARRAGIPVSLCGEMASDPVLLALLVGCGLTSFSMTPGAIPVARQVIAGLRVSDLGRLVARVLRLRTVAEIEQCLLDALGSVDLPGAQRRHEGRALTALDRPSGR